MHKKVRWLTLLLCSTLLFAGCGATETQNSSVSQPIMQPITTQEPTSGPVVTDTPESLNPATPTTTEAPQLPDAEATAQAPILLFSTEERDWFMEDGSTLLMVATDFTVDIEQEGYELLEASIDRLHPGISEDDYALMIRDAEDYYLSLEEDSRQYFWGYSSTCTAGLTRSDTSIVSLRIFSSDYSGGAHGMYAYYGETFDVKTGNLLALDDVLADAAGFYPEAAKYITNELVSTYGDGLFEGYEQSVADTLSPGQTQCWYLTGNGIVIVFNPYEVGPYAMGVAEITLPYTEFGSYLKEEYLPIEGEIIAYLSPNQDYAPLLKEDGPLMVKMTPNEWDMWDIHMVAGEISSELGTFDSLRNGYVIKRTDGKNYFVIVCDYMSDDYVTFVYEVKDGALKKCAELGAVYPSGGYISATELEMNIRIDILGTYIATVHYVLGEDGQLLPKDAFCPIHANQPLHIIRELPVTMDGVKTTLSAGTDILITGTNQVDEVHFKVVGSDRTGFITYTREEPETWIPMIDGLSESEYFEGLPYAG